MWYNIDRSIGSIMEKVIYVRAGIFRHSIKCYGYCEGCILRFRCYTDRGKRLEVTEEEFTLCRGEGDLYSAGP